MFFYSKAVNATLTFTMWTLVSSQIVYFLVTSGYITQPDGFGYAIAANY